MIEVRDMSLHFGSKPVLSHINLKVEQGSFCAVMGANGCGKTTLLRCLSNLLQPNQGDILVAGKNLRDYSARQLAQTIAVVRQNQPSDFEFSAFDTVLMGRNPYQRRLQNESDLDRQIVEESMRLTGTWHLRHSLPGQMSGGELQRVMIARALAQQTPVLLLDEPLSNLDMTHQFEILQLLRNLPGKTILLVIHDINLAYQYCRQLLLLHQGNVLFQGPMKEGLTPDNISLVYGIHAEVDHHGNCLRLSPQP